MNITILDNKNKEFPQISQALDDPNGLLAIGGDLSVERLISAYHQGIFPWFDEDQPILWWSPDPRAILLPSEFRVNRTFRKLINKQQFQFTINQHFLTVIKACADNRKDSGTWITSEMIEAYYQLHLVGFAQSIECYQNGQLVGGLYGLRIGRVFFAESMFRLVDNASKMALYFLCQHMIKTKGIMIDIQIISPHLSNWGAKEISRDKYLAMIRANMN